MKAQAMVKMFISVGRLEKTSRMKTVNFSWLLPWLLLLGCTCTASPRKQAVPTQSIRVGDLMVTPSATLKVITIKGLRYSAFDRSGSYEMSLTYIPASRTNDTDVHEDANRLAASLESVLRANGAKILKISQGNGRYGSCKASTMNLTVKLKTKFERTNQILFLYKKKRYVIESSYFYHRDALTPPRLKKAFATLNNQIVHQLR